MLVTEEAAFAKENGCRLISWRLAGRIQTRSIKVGLRLPETQRLYANQAAAAREKEVCQESKKFQICFGDFRIPLDQLLICETEIVP